MRERSSTLGHPRPGPAHDFRTVQVASVVMVLAAFGLVVAVSAPVATAAGAVVGAAVLVAGRAVTDVRRRLRRDGRPRRVCVPYADVCVEV